MGFKVSEPHDQSGCKTLTIRVFHELMRNQNVPREFIAFKCPICGTVQTGTDLIRAGAGKTFDEIEKYLGFSCVGRWTNAGAFKKGSPSGKGCDWTLGGLFHVHKVEVITEDGEKHMTFELATPEEAQAHMKALKEG